MIQIIPHLWIGDGPDGEAMKNREGWFVVSAAKDPWHRDTLGYTSRGAPKDHPEYLFAERETFLALNLVDTHDPAYVHPVLMNTASGIIRTKLKEGLEVLVHCNQGSSRSPGVVLWYMRQYMWQAVDYPEALKQFLALYPPAVAMKEGMSGFLSQHWEAGT